MQIAATMETFDSTPVDYTSPAGGCAPDPPLAAALSISLNLKPFAFFNVSPSVGKSPLTVVYDATESHDPDGTIVNYEWDLDGESGPLGFVSNGSDPTLEREITTPGYAYPILRLTDNDGRIAHFGRYVCYE
jgi:hypothetical protein